MKITKLNIIIPVFLLGAVLTSCLREKEDDEILPPNENLNTNYDWSATADSVQAATYQKFISADGKYFVQSSGGNDAFHYWWNAHALDILVDAYVRTEKADHKQQMLRLLEGIKAKNGGTFINDFYDDMEWLALSSLRAYRATNESVYLETTSLLWENIKGGWNDLYEGGGIAWRKTQVDYKNTPANAPAVILAARLYQHSKKADDLAWAVKIYNWQKSTLVDAESGLVWDGINRQGDGQIDKNWKFTYNQGVFIGAALELYKATGELAYLNDAAKTADYVINNVDLSPGGILKDEGNGDAGLFKGILVRYLALLVQDSGLASDKRAAYQQFLRFNAETLYKKGIQRPAMFIGANWTQRPATGATIDLSAQLSGVMMIEAAADLKAKGRW